MIVLGVITAMLFFVAALACAWLTSLELAVKPFEWAPVAVGAVISIWMASIGLMILRAVGMM